MYDLKQPGQLWAALGSFGTPWERWLCPRASQCQGDFPDVGGVDGLDRLVTRPVCNIRGWRLRNFVVLRRGQQISSHVKPVPAAIIQCGGDGLLNGLSLSLRLPSVDGGDMDRK